MPWYYFLNLRALRLCVKSCEAEDKEGQGDRDNVSNK